MKTKIFLCLFFMCPPAWSLSAESILISLGETKRLPLHGVHSVWIENKQIINADVVGDSLLLKALHSGESLLRLAGKSYLVQVIHPAQMDSYAELQQALHKIVGLSASADRGHITVQGKLYSLADWKKLAQQNLKYQMRAEISESLQQEAQSYFKSLMKKEHLPRINIIFSDNIEMRVHPKSNYLEKYKNLVSAYGIQVNLDSEVLESAPTIKVQITVAEVNLPRRKRRGITGSGVTHDFFIGLTSFGKSSPCAGASPFSACSAI